jgi:uncharacterized RDD family membrane protein YckC
MVYAGFWERVLAYLVDFALLAVGAGVFLAFLALVTGTPMELMMKAWLKGIGSVFNHEDETPSSAFKIAGKVIGYVVNCLYFTLFESSSWQGTPGKRFLKLKVMDEAGDRISFGLAFWRYLSKFVSAIICGIDYLMVAFTARKQGLHDFMAGTLVCLDLDRMAPPSDNPIGRDKNDFKPLRFED